MIEYNPLEQVLAAIQKHGELEIRKNIVESWGDPLTIAQFAHILRLQYVITPDGNYRFYPMMHWINMRTDRQPPIGDMILFYFDHNGQRSVQLMRHIKGSWITICDEYVDMKYATHWIKVTVPQ